MEMQDYQKIITFNAIELALNATNPQTKPYLPPIQKQWASQLHGTDLIRLRKFHGIIKPSSTSMSERISAKIPCDLSKDLSRQTTFAAFAIESRIRNALILVFKLAEQELKST